MSYKSLLQIFIIILISIILSSIYFLYFSNSKETTVEENNTKLKEIIKDGKEKTNYKLIPQIEPQISEGKILIDQNQTKENKYEPALKENEKKSVDKNILMEV